MNRARQVLLLALAVLAIAFAATWLTLPIKRGESDVQPPASLFLHGLTYKPCVRYNAAAERATAELAAWRETPIRECRKYGGEPRVGDPREVKQRVAVLYGAMGLVFILVGFAFGAGRKPTDG